MNRIRPRTPRPRRPAAGSIAAGIPAGIPAGNLRAWKNYAYQLEGYANELEALLDDPPDRKENSSEVQKTRRP